MKKNILVFVIMMGCISSNAQSIKTLECWRNKNLLKAFPFDLNTLSHFINRLNDSTITPLKKDFDSCRDPVFNKQLRIMVKNKIDSQYLHDIKSNDSSIRSCDFYYDTTKVSVTDTSFLYYYTNKELNDYLSTLKAFQVESKKVLSIDGSMSVFNNSNFLNAYFNVSISRSLLLAAMNNLERYFLLGSVADTIVKTSKTMNDSLEKISKRTMSINDSLIEVGKVTKNSESLLKGNYNIYKPLKSKSRNNDVYKSGDKISTAANTILIDNRKNWWWRSLVGGVIGGLVAGLIVIVFK